MILLTGTAVNLEVQPPVCMVTGEAALTTKARVTNFEISSNLEQIIRCSNSSGEVPTSRFVHRHFKTKFKLEFMVIKELRHLIAQIKKRGKLGEMGNRIVDSENSDSFHENYDKSFNPAVKCHAVVNLWINVM
jgi:hypothetical protein